VLILNCNLAKVGTGTIKIVVPKHCFNLRTSKFVLVSRNLSKTLGKIL